MTGGVLIAFIPVTICILPDNVPCEPVAQQPTPARVLSYQQALSSVKVNMVGLTVTLGTICLCFKEPVLQL